MNQGSKAALKLAFTGIALATAFTFNASAEYRCNPASSWVDREACKAAAQGSAELRRFVERMNAMRINIRYFDYVGDTARASKAQRQIAKVEPDAPKRVALIDQR